MSLISCRRNVRLLSLIRRLSTQTGASFKPNEKEYANARPFESIPGLSRFEMFRRFLPGGKYYKVTMSDIQKKLRDEFGDFYRLPGILGQTTSVTTFDPRDVEYVHRNEGAYPYRRGLQTMQHFRENIRSDIYEVGGLVNE